MCGGLPATLILSRAEVARLMSPEDWLEAVEQGFRAGAEGRAAAPHPLHIEAEGGGFHAKGASILLDRPYAALKFNGNFPGNPAANGLPTVQGALILSDGSNGSLLAIMDSIEPTLRRTAAASALGARLLARPESATVLICGCGAQGRAHVPALGQVLPVRRWLAWDKDQAATRDFARDVAATDGVEVEAATDLAEAALASDVIVTCTIARSPFLSASDVRPGTFIAAVGADNCEKNEIAPDLMAAATIVTDSTAQCLDMGDLRHAVAAGAVSETGAHAELGEIVACLRPGRSSTDEIILFDSTGTALQDVAAAARIYEKAQASSALRRIALGSM